MSASHGPNNLEPNLLLIRRFQLDIERKFFSWREPNRRTAPDTLTPLLKPLRDNVQQEVFVGRKQYRLRGRATA
jgi:hypothetical protein